MNVSKYAAHVGVLYEEVEARTARENVAPVK